MFNGKYYNRFFILLHSISGHNEGLEYTYILNVGLLDGSGGKPLPFLRYTLNISLWKKLYNLVFIQAFIAPSIGMSNNINFHFTFVHTFYLLFLFLYVTVLCYNTVNNLGKLFMFWRLEYLKKMIWYLVLDMRCCDWSRRSRHRITARWQQPLLLHWGWTYGRLSQMLVDKPISPWVCYTHR